MKSPEANANYQQEISVKAFTISSVFPQENRAVVSEPAV
jgi:hypothetical protein